MGVRTAGFIKEALGAVTPGSGTEICKWLTSIGVQYRLGHAFIGTVLDVHNDLPMQAPQKRPLTLRTKRYGGNDHLTAIGCATQVGEVTDSGDVIVAKMGQGGQYGFIEAIAVSPRDYARLYDGWRSRHPSAAEADAPCRGR